MIYAVWFYYDANYAHKGFTTVLAVNRLEALDKMRSMLPEAWVYKTEAF